MARAKQKQIIKKTNPQTKYSESKVFVVVLMAVVGLCDRPVAIKLELES